ncbi:hypothetical protein SteCoe_30739 [Stentor coeruleus]|uniref:Uncharacterized protein n=1 Tax=Stentor coeruleus TaxID=5963 RepID=A0A1R2B2W7_9CILI|nr:hypothetical protein SteCoe_30739 [Stentor coeruleus]
MLDYNMLRIPGSRPFRPSPKKELHIREQSWDNRFHLGQIPEYNAFKDKYLQHITSAARKKKIIIGGIRPHKKKDISISNLAQCISSKSMKRRPVIKNQIIKKLKDSLISIWDQKKIPEPQRILFLEAIDKIPAKKQSTIIVREIESLKADKNSSQMAIRAIKAREHSLNELKDFANTIINPSNVIKHSSVESLLNLRMLSIHVVECIQTWRKNLHDISPESIPENIKFIWENENYLLKMQNDTKFLVNTPMGIFIDFVPNDPFFIHFRTDNGKIELPIQSYLVKKIKDSEIVLVNEGMKFYEEKENPTPKVMSQSRSKVIIDVYSKDIVFEEIKGNADHEIIDYAADVPILIQDSMGKPINAYANAQTMRYPAFLWAKIDRFIVGLITLNLENQKSMHNRLQISHISAVNIEVFDKIAEEIVKYIWKEYPCVEIRVGIISKINEQGKYESEKSIKHVFDKLGFRWKQMIYAINETPVQLLGLRRTENAEDMKVESIFDDCIQISYGCVVQIGQKNETPTVPGNYCSVVGILCAFKPFGGIKHEYFGPLYGKIKGVPPAFRFRKDLSVELVTKDLKSIDLFPSDLSGRLETSISCSALGLSWGKFFPVIHKGMKYTRVLSEIEVLKSEEKTVYIVATEDPIYSVFFIPGDYKNIKNIFSFTKEVLGKIEKVSVSQELWIPSFEVKGENLITELEGNFCSGKCIETCKEIFRFKLLAALHPKGSLVSWPSEKCLIIENGFVFGMIHGKLDEELEIPLYVVNVSSENFISNS